MVDEYRTDEEQIEAIKNWWQENGRSTAVTVVLAFAAVFGWQQWQQGQQEAKDTASLQYQELLDAVGETEQSASLVASAEHLANELKSNHSSSSYAHFAALQMAKLYVDDNKLSDAQEQLQWVLDNRAPDPAISSLARLRLARVVFSMNGAQEAIDLINNVEAGVYKAAYAELRGDLFDELGELEKAEQHYTIARETADASSSNLNSLLDMKYKSVVRRLAAGSPAAAAEPAADAEVAAEEERAPSASVETESQINETEEG